MNATERRRAGELEMHKRLGRIVDYRFEAIRLSLAGRTTFLPDFLVVESDLSITFEEIDGNYAKGDAIAKLGIAAEMYPHFGFLMARWVGGGWVVKRFAPCPPPTFPPPGWSFTEDRP